MSKYSEILLSENASNKLFEYFSNRIQSKFNCTIEKDLSSTESAYRDFKIGEDNLTLHRNTLVGITIFPTKLKEASIKENITVEKIGFDLKYTSSSFETWVKLGVEGEYEINYLLGNIHYCRDEKSKYESNTYKKYNGDCNNHDHCQICWAVISCESPNSTFYSSPRSNVCSSCYTNYIHEDDYLTKVEGLVKIEKSINDTFIGKKLMTEIRKLFRNNKIIYIVLYFLEAV